MNSIKVVPYHLHTKTKNSKKICEELVQYVFHPERLIRISLRNDLELCDLLEIL